LTENLNIVSLTSKHLVVPQPAEGEAEVLSQPHGT